MRPRRAQEVGGEAGEKGAPETKVVRGGQRHQLSLYTSKL